MKKPFLSGIANFYYGSNELFVGSNAKKLNQKTILIDYSKLYYGSRRHCSW